MMLRRNIFQAAAGLGLSFGASASAEARHSDHATPSRPVAPPSQRTLSPWARGVEGQRRADLGDGRFLNPILSGDHPDPTILKDGDTWYMTFSSFEAYPGLVIWSSRDLVNWRPITAALHDYIGSVWAPDLIKHNGRYYLYAPARTQDKRSNYVLWADQIEGPWSAPIDLNLPRHIDPGHAVGEDGSRWLFLSGGDRVRLSDDGLSTVGNVEHVYDPWRYPDDWVVESFSPEGPKICRRGEYFYLVSAVGGTAGPPTGHMVIVARSRSIHGPWENHPNNPIVRTRDRSEAWWSRGHATLFQGPGGTWWMMSHGYEHGFWTLGRQCLLQPVTWSRDGWPIAEGGDLSRPIRKPIELPNQTHGFALSDDFSTSRLGTHWSFYAPGRDEAARFDVTGEGLRLAAKGASPSDSSPVCFIAGDLSYEVVADLEIEPGCEAGLLVFYSQRLYAGLGFDGDGLIMHRYGRQRRSARPADFSKRLHIRLRNDRDTVTLHTSANGETWTKFGVQMDVSGYHHNTMGDFLSLRPAIYAAGTGGVRVRRVSYRAL